MRTSSLSIGTNFSFSRVKVFVRKISVILVILSVLSIRYLVLSMIFDFVTYYSLLLTHLSYGLLWYNLGESKADRNRHGGKEVMRKFPTRCQIVDPEGSK